jgi:hypothetical protein
VVYGAMSGNPVVWGGPGRLAVYYLLLYVFGMATGFAFGSLFLNTPAGIVIYFVYSFVLPGLFLIGGQLMDWFEDIRPWIDFNNDQNDLINDTMHGSSWAHLATSGLLWLVLPLVLGIWRIHRAEVK